MIKKLFAIAIVLQFTAFLANAQQLYFGLGGSGLSTWTTNQNNYGLDFEMDYKPKFGGGFNVNAGYDFSENLGVKLEIGYLMLGQKYEDTHNSSTYSRDVSYNYLQVPVLFKYRSNGESAKFYAQAGPQFNILLSAKQEYLKDGTSYDDEITNPITGQTFIIGQEDVKDRYQSLDIMGRVDLGVEIAFGRNLFLDAGVTLAYGFLDINSSNWQIPDHSSGTYSASHNLYGGINIGINYVIPMGR